MTVALAALCGFPNDVFVIGASDHMVTTGDVEFEQPQPKMWKLNDRTVAMFYGLSAAQSQIALRTEVMVAQRGMTDVALIADAYAWHLRDYIKREAETDVLAPLGLTVADLLRRPATVNQTLLNSLGKQIQLYYEGSGLKEDLGGAIIIGSDDTGAHIYQVEDGRYTFLDSVGFAAGGGGQWHAASQFMFSRYTRWWPFPDALSLLYAAKKRAEVAPGVGSETDIVFIIPGDVKFPVIHHQADSPMVQRLNKIYQEHKQTQDADLESQHKEVKAFIDELIKPPDTPTPVAVVTGEIPPINAEVINVKPKPTRKRKELSR